MANELVSAPKFFRVTVEVLVDFTKATEIVDKHTRNTDGVHGLLKIEAIKNIRTLYSIGLRDAKEIVEKTATLMGYNEFGILPSNRTESNHDTGR